MAALVGISVKPVGGGYICKVPLDLLAQDGVPPEKGDTVSYSVEGTVQSTDEEDATVKITSVNGQPVAESPEEETAEDQGGPPQPGGQAGGAAGAGGRGFPPRGAGAISPATAALGAALRKRARGQPMPF
jgi:hypothetical protein